MRFVLFVLLASSFSACLGPTDEGDGETSTPTTSSAPSTSPPFPPVSVGNHTLDPWSSRPELVNCIRYPFLFEVREQDVQPHLPKGYAGADILGVLAVDVEVRACEAVIVDNQTVLPDVAFVFTKVPVRVNESIAAMEAPDLYLFELFVSNATLRDFLASAGLPAILATITTSEIPGKVQVQVAVNGTLWYDVKSAGGVRRVDWVPSQGRYHHLPPTGPPVWLDHDGEEMTAGDAGSAVLQAFDGFLSRIPPSSDAALVGVMILSAYRGHLTFGHL